MENLILIIHVLIAGAIIGLILLQQGKGAEMGASFGAGASQTVFGSSGSGNFFSRMTAILATVFFITSFGLAILAKQSVNIEEGIPVPTLEEVQKLPVEPAADDSDIPMVETPSAIERDVPEVPELDIE